VCGYKDEQPEISQRELLAPILKSHLFVIIRLDPFASQSRRSSLSNIAQDAFGKAVTCFVSFLYVVIQTGCPILYLILSGDNLKTLLSKIGIDLSVNLLILICGVTMCVPFVFTKNLKEGAWLRSVIDGGREGALLKWKGWGLLKVVRDKRMGV